MSCPGEPLENLPLFQRETEKHLKIFSCFKIHFTFYYFFKFFVIKQFIAFNFSDNKIILMREYLFWGVMPPLKTSVQFESIHPASRGPFQDPGCSEAWRSKTGDRLGRNPCEHGQSERVHHGGWKANSKTVSILETAEAAPTSAWRLQKSCGEGRVERKKREHWDPC